MRSAAMWFGFFITIVRQNPTIIHLERGKEYEIVKRYVYRRFAGFQTPIHQAVSLLGIPPRSGLYAFGSGRKTLRRMCRRAELLGVHCRIVMDNEERESILQLAVDYERHHPDHRYRRKAPDISNLSNVDLWFAAYNSDNQPLVLSVTPLSGDVAVLRYFFTVRSSVDATVARYLLTSCLVDELVERGAKYLIDITHPMYLPSGLHHFAMMLGFKICRVKLVSH